MSGGRHQTLANGVKYLLGYFKQMQVENPSFFYAVQDDEDHSVGNIFWADAASRENYKCFGDTIIFDTTYRINQHVLPFASFTGLNHHGQPVLFGCVLLFNESESSFIWLFETWLHAMAGRHPVSLTTDPDQLIQAAVAQILPKTRHRFCKWGIFNRTVEKVAHIYRSHPTFGSEFQKCINETQTIEEFESYWESLLHRYYLVDNEWLGSLYNARQQWVPVYMRDTFFGEISICEVSEGISSYFDGFVDSSTTMDVLIKQYEKAVACWHEREVKADYDSANTSPVSKTPYPMEKQAAGLYTITIFMKFQLELVEALANPAARMDHSGTVSTYQVAKFGEGHRAHSVRFNSFDMDASCSCQMFEFSGIMCRHILSVYRVKNVLILPSRYVLKRWMRNARKSEHGPELWNNSQESPSVLFNNLRQLAIKYVEEGAKSIHTYNVALEALQEATKKVAIAKSRGFGTEQGKSFGNGGGHGLHAYGEDCTESYEAVYEKEEKIHELSRKLDSINHQCGVYRSNLLAVLKDTEEQKLRLSVKVQNAKLSLKE